MGVLMLWYGSRVNEGKREYDSKIRRLREKNSLSPEGIHRRSSKDLLQKG